jgi:hypothetical protein
MQDQKVFRSHLLLSSPGIENKVVNKDHNLFDIGPTH